MELGTFNHSVGMLLHSGSSHSRNAGIRLDPRDVIGSGNSLVVHLSSMVKQPKLDASDEEVTDGKFLDRHLAMVLLSDPEAFR